MITLKLAKEAGGKVIVKFDALGLYSVEAIVNQRAPRLPEALVNLDRGARSFRSNMPCNPRTVLGRRQRFRKN